MYILNLNQCPGQLAVEHKQALWTKCLHFDPIYNEYRVEGSVIKSLTESIRKSVQICWNKAK